MIVLFKVVVTSLSFFSLSSAAVTHNGRIPNIQTAPRIEYASNLQHRDGPGNDMPVNLTDFPKCATVNCITSDALSPSRLGCVEKTLTMTCLCKTAVKPLSCSPSGPSDQENCWYSLENWFAGVCNNEVPIVSFNSLPPCASDCGTDYVIKAGCTALTRNCFCELAVKPLIEKVTSCLSNCPKHMVSDFSVETWHELICEQGVAPKFDIKPYERYKKHVNGVRGGLTFLVVIIDLCAIGGVAAAIGEYGNGWAVFIAVTVIIINVAILVPIYRVL